MREQDWVGDIDLSVPNVARVYDYYLGGAHNFEIDREFAKTAIEMFPQISEVARRNRAFLRRAVRMLARLGCRQYLDLGSGIPTAGHVHELARNTIPDARVVYVDNESVAAHHSKNLVADLDGVTAVQADFIQPDAVLDHPEVRATLDFDQPIALIFCAAMHLVDDDLDPIGLLTRYRDATVPGSYLALSHVTTDNRPDMAKVIAHYRRNSTPAVARGRAECEAFFDGYRLIEPGVVFTAQWYPDEEIPHEEATRSAIYAGLGQK